MSSPPEYQSLTQRDPDEPRADSKYTQAHSYPPPAASLGEGSGGVGVATVTYTFEPRWPIKGKTEDALGVLYPDREATVQAVRRIFPFLDEYDEDRIEILAKVHVDVGPARWGVIMEDAWPHITAAGSGPKQLKVQIKDLPGIEKRRRRRLHLKICALISLTMSPILALILFAAIMSYLYPD